MQQWISEHIVEVLAMAAVIIPTLIEVAPIKINPWSRIARAIGRALNKEMYAEVQRMHQDLDEHISTDAENQRKSDERFVKQCRLRILRFNDEILQGNRHSKEHFDEILDDVTEYERYCETHPGYKNSKAGMAISNVENVYQRCLAEKDFL